MSYYRILKVNHNVTKEDLRAAWKRLVKLYHPDKSTGDKEKFLLINEAYEVLSDSNKRALYDATLAPVRKQKTRKSGDAIMSALFKQQLSFLLERPIADYCYIKGETYCANDTVVLVTDVSYSSANLEHDHLFGKQFRFTEGDKFKILTFGHSYRDDQMLGQLRNDYMYLQCVEGEHLGIKIVADTIYDWFKIEQLSFWDRIRGKRTKPTAKSTETNMDLQIPSWFMV